MLPLACLQPAPLEESAWQSTGCDVWKRLASNVQVCLVSSLSKWPIFLQNQHDKHSTRHSTFEKLTLIKVQLSLGPFLEAKDVDMQWNQTCIPGPKPPQAQANMLHVVGMMWLPEVTVCLLPCCLHRAPRITSISAHHDIILLFFFLHVCRDNKASAHICLVLTPRAVIRRPMLCKYLERLKDN